VLKPGYQTTEFLIVLLTNVGLIVAASAEWLPPRYAAIGSAVSTAAYALARGLAKLNPPKSATTVAVTLNDFLLALIVVVLFWAKLKGWG
jgi:hypothetical protein